MSADSLAGASSPQCDVVARGSTRALRNTARRRDTPRAPPPRTLIARSSQMVNPRDDAALCKEEGNACMAEQNYVGALKWYSQAIANSPKDGALYSNRSFAFLRLQLPARALADADEAVRRRPTWPKGHFRRAEALSQAGLHADALASYEAGAALDPSDEHLAGQCVAARAREADAQKVEQKHVGIGAAIGVAVLLLLLLSGSSSSGALSRVAAILGGALFGALGGVAYVLIMRQQRKGSVLAPLQTNEHFAAMQMRGDRDGAGELKSSVLEDAAASGGGGGGGGMGMFQQGGATPMMVKEQGSGKVIGPAGGGGGESSGGGGKSKHRVKSNAAGRAAAMKALGKQS